MMANTIHAESRLPGFIPSSPLINYRIVGILLNFLCPSLLICKMGIIIVPSSLRFQRDNAHREQCVSLTYSKA